MSQFLSLITQNPFGSASYTPSPSAFAAGLVVALLLSALMMVTYRLCNEGLSYNSRFNVTLAMLALCTTVILTLIQNNPLFSLGALGALSIVRIRTNTRDPRDLGFVFWALVIGLCTAVGAFLVSICVSVLLCAIMLILGRGVRRKDAITMVVRGEKPCVAEVQRLFEGMQGSTAQSKNLFSDSFELVYELKLPQSEEERLLTLVSSIEGIHDVNILAPQTRVA